MEILEVRWQVNLYLPLIAGYNMCNESNKPVHAQSKRLSFSSSLKNFTISEILFKKGAKLSLEAYTDADWAWLVVDKRSPD